LPGGRVRGDSDSPSTGTSHKVLLLPFRKQSSVIESWGAYFKEKKDLQKMKSQPGFGNTANSLLVIGTKNYILYAIVREREKEP